MLITYAALAAAKRNGTLPALLAAMTPAQRVEAAHVCAANSTRTASAWLRTFGELVEAAELALEERAAQADAQAALAELRGETHCETCGAFDDAGCERCPRCGDALLPHPCVGAYARLEGSVYDLAANRFYCTVAAWPYSPAGRAGATLGELAA